MITAEQRAKIHGGDVVEILIKGRVGYQPFTAGVWIEAGYVESALLANAELVAHIPAKPAWHDAQVIEGIILGRSEAHRLIRSQPESISDWFSDCGFGYTHDQLSDVDVVLQ